MGMPDRDGTACILPTDEPEVSFLQLCTVVILTTGPLSLMMVSVLVDDSVP
jgi:hypothetical protein